jgi:GxxExxY protein
MLTRVPPRLPPELELVVTRTIGCAIRVHKTLGPGFREGIYQDALKVEFSKEGLPCRSDMIVDVFYGGERLRCQKLDLVVDRLIVVEIKAVDRLHPVHQAQLLSYMKAAQLPVGLLMNFNAQYLKSQLRRFVL